MSNSNFFIVRLNDKKVQVVDVMYKLSASLKKTTSDEY
jgi:hypothetical protein